MRRESFILAVILLLVVLVGAMIRYRDSLNFGL